MDADLLLQASVALAAPRPTRSAVRARRSRCGSGAEGVLRALVCAVCGCAARGEMSSFHSELRALGARCRQITSVDARIGKNVTLASAAWFSLARGVEQGPLWPKRVVAHVPHLRARHRARAPGERIVTAKQRDVLSWEVDHTDLLLLALPVLQLPFALELHAARARRFLIVVLDADAAARLESQTPGRPSAHGLWKDGQEDQWDVVDGYWPRGLYVLRRLSRVKDVHPLLGVQKPGLTSPSITFISIIGDGKDFKDHLGASPLYQDRAASPHKWILVRDTGGQPMAPFVADLRARAEREYKSELLLFAHPDVYLPATFEAELQEHLRRLELIDPHWAMAGFFGVPMAWEPEPADWPWTRTRVVGRSRDMYGQYVMGVSNLTVAQCLDESALLFRSSHSLHPSPVFDPVLPSSERLWLGGTAVLLEGLAQGRNSYVLGARLLHKIWSQDFSAVVEQRKRFTRKILNAEYASDYVAAMLYMSQLFLQSERVSKERIYAYFWEFDRHSWKYIPIGVDGPISQ